MTVRKNADVLDHEDEGTPMVLDTQLDHSTAEAAVARAEKAAGGEDGKLADPEPKETEQQLKNRLRNDAEREVLNTHREEFYAIAERLFAKHGLTFVRRLTETEKAAKKIEALIEEHPELEEMIRARYSVVVVDEAVTE